MRSSFSQASRRRVPTGFPEFKGGGLGGAVRGSAVSDWANDRLRALGSGFAEAEVLELGPLEGGHTYMFSQLGAREIVALEANGRAFLKCLVTKEVLGIERARFLLGNALPFLRENQRMFDVGVACAFLNHMLQPVEVIELLAREPSRRRSLERRVQSRFVRSSRR